MTAEASSSYWKIPNVKHVSVSFTAFMVCILMYSTAKCCVFISVERTLLHIYTSVLQYYVYFNVLYPRLSAPLCLSHSTGTCRCQNSSSSIASTLLCLLCFPVVEEVSSDVTIQESSFPNSRFKWVFFQTYFYIFSINGSMLVLTYLWSCCTFVNMDVHPFTTHYLCMLSP